MEQTPKAILDVAAIIGMDAAMRLTKASGKNRMIYIPEPGNERKRSKIKEALTSEELKKLQRHITGPLVYPRASTLKRRTRRASVIAQFKQGADYSTIAGRQGIKRTWVARIVCQEQSYQRSRLTEKKKEGA